MGNRKSAEVAGLLGLFLGMVGAHCWYLGQKRRALIHVGVLVLAVVLYAVSMIVLPLTVADYAESAWLSSVMNCVIVVILLANFLWGLLEGIVLWLEGDAGLEARGFAVAASRLSLGQKMSRGLSERQNPSGSVVTNELSSPLVQENWMRPPEGGVL